MRQMRQALYFSVIMFGGGVTAHAQNAASFLDQPNNTPWATASVSAQMACETLGYLDFAEVTQLKARHVAASGEVPAHCQLNGFIRPQIAFEVVLPDQWNKRLYMFGNGGYAGEDLAAPSRVATRNQALSRGFMTVQQNTGHDARTYRLGDFADGNMDLLIDYASRAVHVTVVTAKEMASRYYDKTAAYSYWDGCSTGGRQGLISAQRYPADFDGIVAGAPVLNFSDTQVWGVWNARALQQAPVSRAQLPVLAAAVMKQCDGLDGLSDGLISDPRQCRFDPQRDLPICEGGQSGDQCFTKAQAQALQTIAEGVRINGEIVFPGIPWGVEGMDRKGESGWNLWLVSEDGPSRQLAYGETFLKNMALLPASGKAIDWQSFDFDKNYPKIQAIRQILDANDPDLSAFATRGGRMLTYFGWADPALNPMMGVQYYEAVRNTMGAEKTAEFYRLFMVPGMNHCQRGYGPDTFDALTPLMAWVERGTAPQQIIASQMEGAKILRQRPLCAYPQTAVYRGQGSIDEAASFECKSP